MLNRLLSSARRPTLWFARARHIAFAAAGAMAVLAIVMLLAARWGWISGTNATFAIFSVLPLIALLVIQTVARLQEVVTMRAGGMAIDTGEDDG